VLVHEHPTQVGTFDRAAERLDRHAARVWNPIRALVAE
jgi:hypothetical protein